ncbi:MAG: DUF1446 domain-containing protein [Proteobacteria bacterium]|nr:DUF1446 domain-containing protein [Pseudomonadota bacterium]
MGGKTVRIGCGSGFWGDSAMAAPQLVHGGGIDYLVSDYLAEVTMSILAKARAKRPDAGYATDFVTVTMAGLLRDIARQGIKVVSNAGGINPLACRDALQLLLDEAGVTLSIAVVLGDDLTGRAGEFRAAGVREMFSGAAFPAEIMSANAYLGGRPIADALDRGADIVITGRCVDSAVTLGPLMHEFGWRDGDLDQLAAGTLAGHIIECGPQCTGGLFTDWRRVGGWENIGYPIVEVEPDGGFILSKPPETDGLICFGSVAEQLLYEIGDPGAYVCPDVTCDFTRVEMAEVGENLVRVTGARGLPPTATYKVSATYSDGYRNQALLVIGGAEAAAKARATAETVLARTRKMFAARNLGDYSETRIECVGAEAMFGAAGNDGSREVVMKLAVRHDSMEALNIFAREFAPAGTSMAPGTMGFGGGRPSPGPVVGMFSFLVEKAAVPVSVVLGEQAFPCALPTAGGFTVSASETTRAVPAQPVTGETVSVPLIKLCYGRSGDKGDNANVGLIARRAEYLPVLRAQVTTDRVRAHFAHVCQGAVERYDLPGIGGMNFVLHQALGGGGMASLHTDNLAKAYAQVLLAMEIEVPAAWAAELAAA